jgi:hypothetical protein
MKTMQILKLAAVASTLVALNARAITVNFIEGAEGQNITIDYNHADWSQVISVEQGTETGTFAASLDPSLGSLASGSVIYGLSEVAGGPLSDWVSVSWDSGFLGVGFTMTFGSDIDGVILEPPGSPTLVLPETGALQSFPVNLPTTAFSLTVGIQSDVEAVPDGGATNLLLGLSSAGLAAYRRFRK